MKRLFWLTLLVACARTAPQKPPAPPPPPKPVPQHAHVIRGTQDDYRLAWRMLVGTTYK